MWLFEEDEMCIRDRVYTDGTSGTLGPGRSHRGTGQLNKDRNIPPVSSTGDGE